jgi:uncharacterized protein (DUF1800 family)
MTETGRYKHFYAKFGFGLPLEAYHRGKNEGFNLHGELDRLGAALPELRIEEKIRPGNLRGMSPSERRSMMKGDRMEIISLNGKWIRSMAENTASLSEKMALFWHDHFACKPNFSYTAESYVNLLRREALGNFRTLLHEMSKEPAMLLYLNNQQNRKSHPNENFAREVMELFTLGIGNYSEEDIKEAARAFTGWSVGREGKFTVRPAMHDYGNKTFFGEVRRWSGEEIIDRLLEEKQTARYVSGKMASFFLGAPPERRLADELTELFYNSNYEITPVVRAIAMSEQFWRESTVANDVVSPVELLVRFERDLGITYESDLMRIGLQRKLGQTLLQPPNVSGWTSGQGWIDAATLPTRLGLSRLFILNTELRTGNTPSFAKGEDLGEKTGSFGKMRWTIDLMPVKESFEPYDFSGKVDAIGSWLLPEPAVDDHPLFETLKELRFDDTEHALALVAALPEYQLK